MGDRTSQDANKATTNQRTGRPNYHILHAQPLPLKTYPLPALILDNPISVAYFAYSYFRQVFFSPSSHNGTKYQAYFSSETSSAHVTDEVAVRALWEHGFFGKGNLSRSEPTWLDREKKRLGLIVGETSEDITRKRREERKAFKKERARKLQEEIDGALNSGTSDPKGSISAPEESVPDVVKNVTKGGSLETNSSNTPLSLSATDKSTTASNPSTQTSITIQASQKSQDVQIENKEHFQLDSFETLFSVYGLGVLEVLSSSTGAVIPVNQLFPILLSCSTFPALSPLETPSPDNKFMLSYVVYHHLRSKGWVVRPGVKFGVDFLLYNRGPVFSHAEFAVVVIPAYTHPYWKDETEVQRRTRSKQWHWLHMVNRVQSQVRKTLVLCYVEVPPPWPEEIEHGEVADVGKILRKYKVREMILKRWVPNRTRD